MPQLHVQPFKTLYLVVRGVGVLVKIPFWLVLSAIPQTRQIRTWTFSRSFIARVLREIVPIMFKVYAFPVPPINPGKGARGEWLWVEPTPELVIGEVQKCASVNGVEAVRVRGNMLYREGVDRKGDEPAGPGEKIIYYLHGGGYIMGDASPNSPNGYLCSEWLKDAQEFSRVFQIDYRLTQGKPLTPKNPFPTALIDAIAGYNYLVNVLGFEPQNIMVAGESAGAHLGIIFTRYLIVNSLPRIPPPASLMLASPVADWGGSHIGLECWNRAAQTDCVQDFHYGYVTNALLGSLPEEFARLSPWMSPGSLAIPDPSGLFKDFPPTLIISGGAECALDQIRTLKDRMTADIGESNVTYIEVPDSLHAFVTMSWHEPEKTQTIKKIVEWGGCVHSK